MALLCQWGGDPHEAVTRVLNAPKPHNILFISLSHFVMPPPPDGVLYLSCLAHLGLSQPVSVLGVPNPLLFNAVVFVTPPNNEQFFIHATLRYPNECPPTDPAQGFYKLVVKGNVFVSHRFLSANVFIPHRSFRLRQPTIAVCCCLSMLCRPVECLVEPLPTLCCLGRF